MTDLSTGPLKRKTVTLFCFLMAISILSSTFIYIDSNSLPTWWKCYNNVGPIAMRVFGENLDLALDEIRSTTHVTKASLVEIAPANLRMDKDDVYHGSPDDPLEPMFLLQGNAYSLSDDFVTDFPLEFEIVQGRYPQNSSEIAISAADAAYWAIPIGRMMNYTHTLNGEKRTVFVVGLFRIPFYDPLRYAASEIIAIVTSDVLNPLSVKKIAYVDVDRSILSPMDPRRSLNLLLEIENTIVHINPTTSLYFRYFVDNYLAIGVQSYLDSLNLQRARQISRTQLLLFLSVMIGFLAVRFNMSLRQEELDFYVMRGASRARVLWIAMREFWILSIFSSMLSIVLGAFLSRIADASGGYLEFSWRIPDWNSILFATDTLLTIGIVGFCLPVIGYVTHKAFKSSVRREIEQGRLARLTSNIRLIRWDVLFILFVILLLLTLYYGGQSVSSNPILLLIAGLAPIPLILAFASILSKGIGALATSLSRLLRSATGKIPAAVGIRGVARNDNTALPIIIIASIMLSSCLASNVVAASIPETHLIQTRYLIGGDLAFLLDNGEAAHWSDFSRAILQHNDTLATSLVSIGQLTLSEGSEGIFEFVAVGPEEYSHVGYDCTGEMLDRSVQNGLLEGLETNPEGVVLTADIASEYDLAVGDTLRAFSFWDKEITVEFSIVGVTDAFPRPMLLGRVTSDSVVGTRKLWLNRDYLGTFLDLNATAESYLCVRVTDNSNTTKLGENVLVEYEPVIRSSNGWSSISAEMTAFQSLPNYRIDRAIDSMMSASFVLSAFAALTVFHLNRRQVAGPEDAVLETLGGTKGLILQVRMAEILALVFFSFFLVTVFVPIDIARTLRIHVLEYSTWRFAFPVSVFARVDWFTYFGIVLVLLVPAIALIAALSTRTDSRSIADVLTDTIKAQRSSSAGDDT